MARRRMDNVGIVVDDMPATIEFFRQLGRSPGFSSVSDLVSSEVDQYEDAYRLWYIRGPGGLLIGLAEELG